LFGVHGTRFANFDVEAIMNSRFPYTLFRTGMAADPFALLNEEIHQLFGQTFRQLGAHPPVRGRSGDLISAVPPMDVTETEQEIVVEFDVPGVSREQLELSLDDDVLTIRGRRQRSDGSERRTQHLAEREQGAFERKLQLPFKAELEQCAASLRDGVLTIRLAKSDVQRKARRIEVREGEQWTEPQRPQLEHGQTEVLDAEKPANEAAKRDGRSGSAKASRSGKAREPRTH
jgi:HSP20 family protein